MPQATSFRTCLKSRAVQRGVHEQKHQPKAPSTVPASPMNAACLQPAAAGLAPLKQRLARRVAAGGGGRASRGDAATPVTPAAANRRRRPVQAVQLAPPPAAAAAAPAYAHTSAAPWHQRCQQQHLRPRAREHARRADQPAVGAAAAAWPARPPGAVPGGPPAGGAGPAAAHGRHCRCADAAAGGARTRMGGEPPRHSDGSRGSWRAAGGAGGANHSHCGHAGGHQVCAKGRARCVHVHAMLRRPAPRASLLRRTAHDSARRLLRNAAWTLDTYFHTFNPKWDQLVGA